MKAELEEIWSILGMPNSVLRERDETKNTVDEKYQCGAPVDQEGRTRNDDGGIDLFQLIDQWQWGQSTPDPVPSLNLANTVELGLRCDERDEVESKDALFEQPRVAAVPPILSRPTVSRQQAAQAATNIALQEVSNINNTALKSSPNLNLAREMRSRSALKKKAEVESLTRISVRDAGAERLRSGSSMSRSTTRRSANFKKLLNKEKRTKLISRNILRNCRVDINKTLANSYLPSSGLRIKENKFICNICGKNFKIRSSLRRHQSHVKYCNKQQSTRFECDVCKKTFVYRCTMKRHQNTEHKGIKSDCVHCKETFKHSYQLAKHMREEHKEILPLCEICDKHFLSESELKRHQRNEHNQPDEIFNCSKCSFQSKYVGSQRNHMKFHHSDKFLFCELCPLKTKYPSALKIHMKKQHKNQKVLPM